MKLPFLMHQATETLYHCVLLVFTLYSPKSHRLTIFASLRGDAGRIGLARGGNRDPAGSCGDGMPKEDRGRVSEPQFQLTAVMTPMRQYET
jgi:hypothetical protein